MKNGKKLLSTIAMAIVAALLLFRRIGRNIGELNNNLNLTPGQAGSPLYIFIFAIIPIMYAVLPVIRSKLGKAKAYLVSAVCYAVWGFGGLALCAMGLLGEVPRGAFLLLLIVVVGVVAWDLYLYRHYTNNEEE